MALNKGTNAAISKTIAPHGQATVPPPPPLKTDEHQETLQVCGSQDERVKGNIVIVVSIGNSEAKETRLVIATFEGTITPPMGGGGVSMSLGNDCFLGVNKLVDAMMPKGGQT